MYLIHPVILGTLLAMLATPALTMDADRGGELPQPLFPESNWWNQDIRAWPVDPQSSSYIAFINNGGTRRLHPDFGGNADAGYGIYGMPYAVVSEVGATDLQPVTFQYWDESDGVDYTTGKGLAFYPIPPAAIRDPYWIEGGDPGHVDLRGRADRHLLIVDRDRNFLYEMYNVFYKVTEKRWYAGSGAFFDMNSNVRRPEGWTSADAAGLAILPGLVRYDEVYDPSVGEIKHAFRVTVRTTNGYVYPASHRAGSTTGALPMGARLRLKSSVDVTTRTVDPNVQKIFRAMQAYGLIVADNGSDLYITGTYDTRWNNDVLNPAFRNLTANDFEVIRLGYNPAAVGGVALSSIGVVPTTLIGGQEATVTVALSGSAPAGGATVSLTSANPAVPLPSAVTILAGTKSTSFGAASQAVSVVTAGNISATYRGVTKSATITVKPALPAALSSLAVMPSTLAGGKTSVGTVRLTQAAPSGGFAVRLASSNPSKAIVPNSVVVPQGARTQTFDIVTSRVTGTTRVKLSARAGAVTKTATLRLMRR